MTQALLVMDLQNGPVARLGDRAGVRLDTLEGLIAEARVPSVPVIFVRVAFCPDAPEISPRNQRFSALKDSSPMDETSDLTSIHPRLTPGDCDVLVTKRRVSAFSGSDPDVVLRSLSVDHRVLTGIPTSEVVLSTTRQVADVDFRLTVIADGCADVDPEVHRVLTEKVIPRQATVRNANDWIANP